MQKNTRIFFHDDELLQELGGKGAYIFDGVHSYVSVRQAHADTQDANVKNREFDDKKAGGDKMVDFEKYEEMKIGEKEKTEIAEINEGVQSDFRTENYWEATNLTKQQIQDAKKQTAIEIKTANGASLVINMPTGNKIHPKSSLARFKKTYGDFPKIGMTVETKLDDNGFQRVVIET